MTDGPELLLIGAVIAVGVLHTIVPDHWVPITVIARQQGWSRRETTQAALRAGTGHVVSTLVIGVIVWLAGVAFATRFGNAVSMVSSVALIGFGGWIAVTSMREMKGGRHSHVGHSDELVHDAPHGPEKNAISTPAGELSLSIFERGTPPRFRVTGVDFGTIVAQTIRPGGARQNFPLINLGLYWESVDPIPEPHDFTVSLSVTSLGRTEVYETQFTEHDHAGHHAGHHHAGHDHAHPSPALTHAHPHRHVNAAVHVHRHEHDSATWHRVNDDVHAEPPLHSHDHKMASRTALLLILGSSPMVEGLPAFFAASKYGPGLIAVMSLAFAVSTILTYVALCVLSTAGLQRVNLGSFEKYGEVISGAFIAVVGCVFLIFPLF